MELQSFTFLNGEKLVIVIDIDPVYHFKEVIPLTPQHFLTILLQITDIHRRSHVDH